MLANKENPYFAKIEREFIEAYSKRADLISDMSSTSFEECKKNEERIAALAAQLIRSGVEADIKGKNVEVTVGEEIYVVSKTNLRKTLAEDYWIIFPEVVDDTEVDTPLKTYEHPQSENEQLDAISAVVNPIISAVTNDESIKNSITKLLTAFFPPVEKKQSIGLIEDINSIQKRVEGIESERISAVNRLESMEKEYSYLKEELDATSNEYSLKLNELEEKDKEISILKENVDTVTETYKKASEMLESKENIIKEKDLLIENKDKLITEKDSILNDFKSKIGNLRSQINSFESDKKLFSEQIHALSDEKNQISRDLLTSEREKDELAKKILELESNEKKLISNSENLKDQLKKSVDSSKLDDLQRQNNNLKSERDACKNKLSDLQKKLEESENKLADARKYKDIAEAAKKEAEESKSKLLTLENLAYIDQMTQVKNVNSFNKEFGKLDLKASVIIMVGIRGVKKLNAEKGRKTGDKIIKFVASSLAKVFGNELMYRIIGDQFVIVSNTLKYVEAESEMYKIKNSLQADDVDIVYGMVSGFSYENPREVLEAVEQLMNRSKNKVSDIRGYAQAAPVTQMNTSSFPRRQDFSANNISVDED